MKFRGKINNINHVVISDPSYKKGVWCRYEKENLNETNWLVNLDISLVETKVGEYYLKGTEFSLLLKKNTEDCSLDDERTLSYMSDIKLNDYKIAMDTACVALGINDNAKEIIDCREEWQPSCAIRTGGDGIFGEVSEGTQNDKLCFLLITGYFEEDFINENELFEYLKDQFEIVDLVKEDHTLYGNNRELNKGDKVEVSSCSINNDVGGTTTIRNSGYEDVIDGMSITVENPDGTIGHSILSSHDKLVNLPIKIEVIDRFYDYETGYRYKGKIIDEKLLEEFKNFGTTGFKPEDYKKCKDKSIYEDTLKACENYDPSIVYFSEFDVIKLLEKSTDKEMEI